MYWHQDNAYWQCAPPNLVSIWIALDDADEENGCMNVIPGSYSEGLAAHGRAESEKGKLPALLQVDADVDRAVPVPVAAGCVMVHHCMTLHQTQSEPLIPRPSGDGHPLHVIRYTKSRGRSDERPPPATRQVGVKQIATDPFEGPHSLMSSTELKATFNTAATLYEDIRPGYPEELIRDVIDLSGLENHSRILEIGCGTGKATRSFAERGYELVCLDIGTDLIAVARERLGKYPNASFVQQAFEEWKPEGTFDLIISATAFHWVDPKVRYLRASEALRSNGSLAIFSNQHVREEGGFFAESQSLYDRYYHPLTTNSPAHATNFPGAEAFQNSIQRVYPWTQTYSPEQYIKLLGTYSGHIALPDENKRLLFEGITNLIETRYDGQITKHYEAVLDLRQTK